jgi:hypothetical protein
VAARIMSRSRHVCPQASLDHAASTQLCTICGATGQRLRLCTQPFINGKGCQSSDKTDSVQDSSELASHR